MKLAFLTAFVCVAYLIFATFSNLSKTEQESKKINTSLGRLIRLENILVNIKSIESGQRGFILSGQDQYLSSYYRGLTGIKRDTAALKELKKYNKAEDKIQAQLLQLIHQKVQYASASIEAYRHRENAVSISGDSISRGIVLMDSINVLVIEMEKNDKALLHSAYSNTDKLARQTTWQLSLLAGVFLFILGVTYYITARDFKKIVASERKLQFNTSLIRNISDPIISTNTQDEITNWNSYAEQLYGFSEGEVLGKNIFDLLRISPEHRELEYAIFHQNENDYWKGESVHHHKNGNSLFVEVSVASIKNDFGNTMGYVSVIRDITMRKKAEAELTRLKDNLEDEVKIKSAELRNVFSRITDAFIALDNNWNYTYLNKLATELHGRPAEELLGKNIWQEFPDVMLEPFYDALQLAKHTGEPQRVQLYYSKVNRWYEDMIYPSADGISVYYHDITARKEAELQLQLAHEKLNYHINNTPMGVVEFDLQGRVLQWNQRASQIFGWSLKEALQMNDAFNTMAVTEDKQRARNMMEELSYKHSNQSMIELQNVTKDNRIIYCTWYISVLRDKEENIIGLMSLVIDTTDKHLALQSIEDSKQLLQKSNERFELVAKATNDAIWDWDLNQNIIWGNEAYCKLFGTNPEESFSLLDFEQTIHPDDREWVMQTLLSAFDNRETFVNVEFKIMLPNRLQYITVNDSAHILYNDEGKPMRLLGALQDITQEKLYQQNIILEKELSDSIINSLPGIFYLYSTDGVLYRWNKNFETVSGYSSEEIKRIRPMMLIDPEQIDMVKERIANVYKAGEDFVEANLVTRWGNKIPFYFTGRIIHYEGEPCLMGVGIDISERVKSQLALAASEEKYRSIIEQASDGIFISDEKGRYLDVNSKGEKLSGYTKEELLKLSIFDLMGTEADKDGVIETNLLEQGQIAITEIKMKQKSGHYIDVEISARHLMDGRYIGMVRDITERKKAQEALKISEEKYRLLFYQNPMPMWMLSLPNWNFLDVNQAAIDFYGFSRQQFLSMSIMDLEPKGDKEHYMENIDKQFGVNDAGQWDLKKENGKRATVNIISHYIFYEEQPALLVLANDITEKILAEEKLKESHENYRQLASHLETIREAERTHIAREIHDELGQQLTGLKMDISWLSKKINNEDLNVQIKVQETIGLIDATVKTVRRIATELRPSILDDLGLIAAMEWQTEEFEKRSDIKGIFISNVAAVQIDTATATGLFRIYQESLTNVMRHSQATQMEANLHLDKQFIKLTIHDNGKGFAIDAITNKKTLGILGMRERATLMGGSYEITSMPQKGTQVIIIVPLKK